ncbi:GNAT family N-acetyltransferase [Micromonospora peucetia]|uniref:GNAT family N-acetyltransferase n=2 Tax=Micromonospora peucetia TaxID=47871 RepID=A0ABZ1EF78_9ACTN|nr:GNAT family N-acetyltransferase [Micromonospora peucetia]MCX4390402.1 GNAT family N-acetyltransferase [Micromonospora peucetia]WSA32298.1 GNAT family N-acetyltransferase [Micromonospora peucetia]
MRNKLGGATTSSVERTIHAGHAHPAHRDRRAAHRARADDGRGARLGRLPGHPRPGRGPQRLPRRREPAGPSRTPTTDPAHRRRGLGRVVMRALCDQAAGHGTHTGILVATHDGRAFYSALGWTVHSPVSGAFARGPGLS